MCSRLACRLGGNRRRSVRGRVHHSSRLVLTKLARFGEFICSSSRRDVLHRSPRLLTPRTSYTGGRAGIWIAAARAGAAQARGLPASHEACRADPDAHLVRVPDGRVRLQGEEAGGLRLPELLDARQAPLLLPSRGAAELAALRGHVPRRRADPPARRQVRYRRARGQDRGVRRLDAPAAGGADAEPPDRARRGDDGDGGARGGEAGAVPPDDGGDEPGDRALRRLGDPLQPPRERPAVDAVRRPHADGGAGRDLPRLRRRSSPARRRCWSGA